MQHDDLQDVLGSIFLMDWKASKTMQTPVYSHSAIYSFVPSAFTHGQLQRKFDLIIVVCFLNSNIIKLNILQRFDCKILLSLHSFLISMLQVFWERFTGYLNLNILMAEYFHLQSQAILILVRTVMSNHKVSSSPPITSQASRMKFNTIEGST